MATTYRKKGGYPINIFSLCLIANSVNVPKFEEDVLQLLTWSWKREYEERDCALTLREEVADERPGFPGSEWPGELKAGSLAGLSISSSTGTSFSCMGST
jgi:hypothetical protein